MLTCKIGWRLFDGQVVSGEFIRSGLGIDAVQLEDEMLNRAGGGRGNTDQVQAGAGPAPSEFLEGCDFDVMSLLRQAEHLLILRGERAKFNCELRHRHFLPSS